MPSSAINGVRAEIKTALRSTTTCSTETVTTLHRILHGRPESLKGVQEGNHSKSPSVAGSSTAAGRKRNAKVTNGESVRGGGVDICEEGDECFSSNEKYLLATEVANITLKTLTDAARRASNCSSRLPHHEETDSLVVSDLKLEPSSLSSRVLRETSLNAVLSLPVKRKEPGVPASRLLKNESSRSGVTATADCSRLAFEYLINNRATKSTTKPPDWQLENGILAFIGRLLALNLQDMAAQELRSLRMRLSTIIGRPKITKITSGGKSVVITPTICKEQIALANLLYNEHVELQEPALQMVINYQLLVLKLIAASRRSATIEAAMDYLDFSYNCSLGNLILRSSKMAESAHWAARQLEVFAQILLSTCPSLATANDCASCDGVTYPTPEICLQVQTLAFEARTKWMKIAGHCGDSDFEIIRPFSKCLAAFSRRSKLSSSAKYSVAVRLTERLHTNLNENKTAMNIKTADPGAATLDLYSQLSYLAEKADLNSEALQWCKRLITDDTNLPPSKRCAQYSRLAALYLKDKRNTTEWLKVEPMIFQAVKLLDGELDGEAADLHDVLREAVELRNAAFQFLRMPAADAVHDTHMTKHACRLILTSFVRLLDRCLTISPPDAGNTQAILRWKDRVKTVNRLSKSSIDSIISSCNFAEVSKPDSWLTLDAALQGCCSLLRKLETVTVKNDQGQGESAEDDKHSPHVRISGSYWTFHTKRKVEPVCQNETGNSLRRSCDVLRDRSAAEKDAGSLPWKLSRLGRSQQCREDYVSAKQSYLDSVKVAIEIGTLNEAVHDAAASSPSTLSQDDGKIGVLFKAVKAVVELHVRYNSLINTSPLSSIEESIGAPERGLLLEWQLIVATLCLHSSQTAVNARRLTSVISQLLLQTYDEDSYPLRRRRAIIGILRLVADDPGSVDAATLKVAEECAMKADSKYFGADGALVKYQDHFRASLNVCLAFRTSSSDLEKLKAALSTWVRLLETSTSCSDVRNRIGDLESCLSQLQSMCEYFHMQGLQSLHVSVLQLLLKVYELPGAPNALKAISTMIELGLQCLHLGYSGKAGLYLAKAQDSINANKDFKDCDLPHHLALIEYFLALGNIDKCEENFLRVRKLFDNDQYEDPQTGPLVKHGRKVETIATTADIFYVYSQLRHKTGPQHEALLFAKRTVILLQRVWASLESKFSEVNKRNQNPNDEATLTSLSEDLSGMVISSSHARDESKNVDTIHHGPRFWPLLPRLYKALLHLSRLLYHNGMFQDAVYQVEQAHKLAVGVLAENLIAQSLVSKGDYIVRAGDYVAGGTLLERADALYQTLDKSKELALHHCSQGHLYRMQSQWQTEFSAYDLAEKIIDSLAWSSSMLSPSKTAKNGLSQALPKSPRNLICSSSREKLQCAKPTTTAGSQRMLRKKMVNALSTKSDASASEHSWLFQGFKDGVLRRKAESLLAQGNLEYAARILSSLDTAGRNFETRAEQRTLHIQKLVLEALASMATDSVFSLLPEATISFPAIVQATRRPSSGSNRNPAINYTPSKTLSAGAVSPRKSVMAKANVKNNFEDLLCQALDQSSEMRTFAINLFPGTTLRQVCAASTTVSMYLSSVKSGNLKRSLHPSSVAYSIELPQSLACIREKSAVRLERSSKSITQLLSLSTDTGINGDTEAPTIGRFQCDFINVIPESWIAISLALADDRNHLYITRYQAEQCPFVLRLPLIRQNVQDPNFEDEKFDFMEAKSELLQIIELSEATVRRARDNPEALQAKGAKSRWWAEREELDQRLRDLLLNIENVWLGGFRGIFSQHRRHPDLLARFQQTFENILDKHLPSRQGSKKRSGRGKVALDLRIFELFIGLGSAADEDHDMDEAFTDLLYFVVDILQFNGEGNAYDEIDFDSIIVETQDALHSYRENAHLNNSDDLKQHTILILDKQLHAFPWESLPCLENLSVSRLSSLSELRDRVLNIRSKGSETSANPGIQISSDRGTYVLNPSGDLAKTQTRFQTPLVSLSTTLSHDWTAIIGRPPTETEFTAALSSIASSSFPTDTGELRPSLLLYFGHGSGAQYIRSKTIKQLMPSCGVALLFGCSSASLKEVGEFEPYGTPRTYLTAGSPAVLGSLWDVTDVDCDRFAGGVLQRWGLLKEWNFQEDESTKKSGKKARMRAKELEQKKAKDDRGKIGERLCLSEAVARSRDECYLKYLNGAAMVVYGVPVYLSAS